HLNFPLLHELSNKKDASTWDIMDLLCLDDAVAEALGMTDLQPDIFAVDGWRRWKEILLNVFPGMCLNTHTFYL
ncbi:hypothetical protein Tco_0479921, partial [Tanacetum coccineum]